MRERVILQSLTRVSDGGGGVTITPVDFATVWAAVEPLEGNERFQAQQVDPMLSHRIMLRWRTGVASTMRVLYGSRVFDVKSVIDPEERHKELVLLCEET